MNKWWSLLLVAMMALGAGPAAAKRLDADAVVAKPASSLTPQVVAQSAVANQIAPVGGAASAPVGLSRWGAVLAGVSAGLGVVWLASALGLGEGLVQWLLLALFALLAWTLIRAFRRRGAPEWTTQGAYASAEGSRPAVAPRGYSPRNVGNDASARPWENQPSQPVDEPARDTAASMTTPWGVPADFDTAGFLHASKLNFVSLQDAWDRADIASLRAMMTDSMLAEIKSQLGERELAGAGDNKTEVVMLEARLLGIEELAEAYLASVEFSGLIREEVSAGPNPFREVWAITRPKSNASGWLVAGVQALQ